MPARRNVVAVMAGALVLAGCQQPSPGVTLVSGRHSVRATAVNYCRGTAFLTKVNGDECRSDGRRVNVLYVDQGDAVGVDVDKALADSGWSLVDLDSQQTFGFQTQHYQSIVADFSNRPTKGIINLEVREVDHRPTSDQDLPKVIGQWDFQLAQR